MTNFETFYDADLECANMFPPRCGVGGICRKPQLSSLSWRRLEYWRRWPTPVELNGARTDRTLGAANAWRRTILFWSSPGSAVSYLIAVSIAERIRLINTMEFTQLTSNVPLMLVPKVTSLWPTTHANY